MALTGRVAILAAREGGEAIKANKIATSVGSVPRIFTRSTRSTRLNDLTPTVEKAACATAAASAPRVSAAAHCPERAMAGAAGIEPTFLDLESSVLPLYIMPLWLGWQDSNLQRSH